MAASTEGTAAPAAAAPHHVDHLEKMPSEEGEKQPVIDPSMLIPHPEKPTNLAPGGPEYPQGLKLFLIILAMELYVFIISLDQTIVAPATPVLSNQFDALQDIGWYTAAYLMTTTAMQPLWGRLFGLFDVKLTYIATIVVFEIGSIVCASAQSSNAFIAGRAIAGVGLGGGYVGTMLIITLSAPLEKVPLYTSLIGMAYGAGAVTGPIIGGALTSEVTWRWCFWLNLPCGGLTLALVILFLHVPKWPHNPNLKRDLLHLDILGTVLLLGAVTCYLLVCQYGGFSWPWDSSRAIGLLIGGFAIACVWVLWEGYWGEDAAIPLRLLKQRTIAWGSLTNALVAGGYFALLSFLSIWFQAVQGSSAIRAGVQTLPFICAAVFFTMVAGIFTTVIGHYKPPMLFGFVMGSIGSGLLYTMNRTSDSSKWIGYQFMAGILGASFQLTYVASQTVHNEGSDRQRGGSIVIFFQTLGGALFAGAAQVIYSNKFSQAVNKIPGIDVSRVSTGGATAFRDLGYTQTQVDAIADAAVNSIKYAFLLAAVASAVGAFTTFGLETNDVRPPKVSHEVEAEEEGIKSSP